MTTYVNRKKEIIVHLILAEKEREKEKDYNKLYECDDDHH